jgi:hypothetical protein
MVWILAQEIWLQSAKLLTSISPKSDMDELTQLGCQDLLAHHIITHWTCMEDIKGVSSNRHHIIDVTGVSC